MTPPRPLLQRVLETVLYYRDQDRTEHFYQDVLGLQLIGREPGRYLFFRAGSSVVLLFRAEESLKQEKLPPHGAYGPIHTCFLVAAKDYEPWKEHLSAQGVEILQETRWSPGLSFYFHDPDGNVLEIADRDIWPTAPGQPSAGGP